MEYVSSLKNSLEESIREAIGANLSSYDKEKISNALSGLSSVNIRLKSVSEFGFGQLRSSAVKPRVKPWLDAFFHAVRNPVSFNFSNRFEFFKKLIIIYRGPLLMSWMMMNSERRVSPCKLSFQISTPFSNRLSRPFLCHLLSRSWASSRLKYRSK